MRRTLAVALVIVALAGPGSAAAVPTPPPTPVPPYGSPSPFPTALETAPPSTTPPAISAASAALVDLETGDLLWGQRAARRRPIASVTKVMTALVVLESAAPSEEVVASPLAAAQEGAVLGLEAGERIAVRDLLFALMLQSSNDAAVALAEHVAGSAEAFIALMNDRAAELGLRDTRFASANGLDDDGYSTARDLGRILTEAYRIPAFAEVAGTRFRRVDAPAGPDRRIQNRNVLLWLYPGALGGKTGYTAAAGFCLAAAAERDGLRLAAVLLGGLDEVFSDAAALLDHGFAAFERRVVVEAGDPLPPLRVEGRLTPVAAADRLEVLLRRDEEVRVAVTPAPRISLPVDPGDRLGLAVASVAGDPAGSVPAIAAESVNTDADASDDDPWWRRGWSVVLEFLVRMIEVAAARG